jgi:hypothetical protein
LVEILHATEVINRLAVGSVEQAFVKGVFGLQQFCGYVCVELAVVEAEEKWLAKRLALLEQVVSAL